MAVKRICLCLFLLIIIVAKFNENKILAAENILAPLKVHRVNPRYFSDHTGKAIYLTGSHTWDNFIDFGGKWPEFDYFSYLEFLKKNNHNFIRLWVGTPRVDVFGETLRTECIPWQRTGPGKARDGGLRFDLTKLDEKYFARLRSRVSEAGKKGIYVSIMLFNGLLDWNGHPFNIKNNINGVDGDLDKKGNGESIYRLHNSMVLTIQKNYVKKVIDSVNDLDNVLYEVGNEIQRYSLEWQYHIIDYIKDYQKKKPKQHPVGMTSSGGDGPEHLTNSDLYNSPADWISPRSLEPGQNYSSNPPPANGKKVIISDTDHLAGILENPTPEWVWKSFLRGVNPILMDVVQNKIPGYDKAWNDPNRPGLAETRRAMGQTLRYANRVNLTKMVPSVELASTNYCLANAGEEYLVYLPFDDVRKREKVLQRFKIMDSKIWVDLFGVKGMFRIEWFNPKTDEVIDEGTIAGGGIRYFKVPFRGDAVLYLYRQSDRQ